MLLLQSGGAAVDQGAVPVASSPVSDSDGREGRSDTSATEGGTERAKRVTMPYDDLASSHGITEASAGMTVGEHIVALASSGGNAAVAEFMGRYFPHHKVKSVTSWVTVGKHERQVAKNGPERTPFDYGQLAAGISALHNHRLLPEPGEGMSVAQYLAWLKEDGGLGDRWSPIAAEALGITANNVRGAVHRYIERHGGAVVEASSTSSAALPVGSSGMEPVASSDEGSGSGEAVTDGLSPDGQLLTAVLGDSDTPSILRLIESCGLGRELLTQLARRGAKVTG